MFLVALSAVLCLAALPGGPLPVFAWISLVPLGLAIHRASAVASAGYGFAFGFLAWLGSTGGLVVGLSSYAELPQPEAVFLVAALCALLALPYGLFGFLYGRFQWMNRPLGPLRTAACLSLLVSLMPTPLPVGPGHALYVFPMFIQLLDLGGEPLLFFALCLVNWIVVDLILRISRRAHLAVSSAALCLVLGTTTAYGWYRLQQHAAEERLAEPARLVTIAAIQPNIPLPTHLASGLGDSASPLTLLRAMSAQSLEANPHIDLVVWPEIPTVLDCTKAVEAWRADALAGRSERPFLINCAQPAGRRALHNTALLISKSGAAAYHKQRLLPFAEYLPGEKYFPKLRKLIPGAASIAPGHEDVVFSIHGSHKVAAVICYEILFADQVSAFARKGADLLVNPGNDAWFGDSRVPAFMIAAAVYRATEYRMPLIRTSNSGSSLVVKASGEIVPRSRTASFTRAASVTTVFVPRQRAAYAAVGKGLCYCLLLSWAAFELCAWFARRSRIEQPRHSREPGVSSEDGACFVR